jgi:hypothetical protein
MASVCVGCGLKVTGGLLEADLPVVTGYVGWSTPIIADAVQLAIYAPIESPGPGLVVSQVVAEMGVLEVKNPHTCRSMTFFVQAHGRVRIDVQKGWESYNTSANECRNEIRWNEGSWYYTDVAAYASDGADANALLTREWNGSRPLQSIVVKPGGTLTFDRRCAYRWEDIRVVGRAVWNMPAISVFGI